MRNTLFAAAALCSFAGCSTTQTATVNATVAAGLATAQADLAKAVQFYGVIKGVALVAEAADPSLVPTVTKAFAVLDPLMATAQTLVGSATADAPTVEALAAQIQTQAATLATTAAPAIKVVGG